MAIAKLQALQITTHCYRQPAAAISRLTWVQTTRADTCGCTVADLKLALSQESQRICPL